MKNLFFTFFFISGCSISIWAQLSESPPVGGSIAVSPARFELEMKPGSEKTVVVNVDYRSGEATDPVRIVSTLNDWNITNDGRVEYFRVGSQSNSASPWLIHSPGEAAITPGKIHQIRVTISVPPDAAPGDHLSALIIEQRPEKLSSEANLRQMVVRYRMASVFYIKVPGLTQRGIIENLYAEATPEGVVITPTLKNEGNSMIRPLASVKIFNEDGKIVADLPEAEQLPVLAGAQLNRSILLEKALTPGNYTVKYRVDFQDGSKAIEGITPFTVQTTTQIATKGKSNPKP